MRFWDSSAILSLLTEQVQIDILRKLFKDNSELVVSWSTKIELVSGICRLVREGLDNNSAEKYYKKIDRLTNSSFEVDTSDKIRNLACNLLKKHPLRAADALQLASALEWSGSFGNAEFVCLDKRLREAAEKEGFKILPK